MLLSLFIILIFFSSSSYAIEPDKKAHLKVSVVIGATSQIFFKNMLQSFGTCISIGAIKEIYDDMQPSNKMDVKDLAFDAVGCFIGNVMMTGVQNYLAKK